MRIQTATITRTDLALDSSQNNSLTLSINFKFDKVFVGRIFLNLENSSDLSKLKKLMEYKKIDDVDELKRKKIKVLIHGGSFGEVVGFGIGNSFYLTNTEPLNIPNYAPEKVFSEEEILKM